MAKVKVEKNKEEEKKELLPEQQASAYLTENKKDHYNFEKQVSYKVKSGSLKLDLETGGGLGVGVHRFTGSRESGKTNSALTFMRNFLIDPKYSNRRGLYVKSEGRLSEEVKQRVGVNFVTDPKEWVHGTCLILESNVFEFVFGFLKELVFNNPTETNYFTVIDSADTLCLRDDLDKPFEDSNKVAGGGLITSTFFKKMGLALAKRGHICIFTAQNRQFIKIDPRTKTPQRQGDSSGGNSIQHQTDWCLNFLTRLNDDLIIDSSDKILGHYCKIEFLKSTNEKTHSKIKYPIKYRQKNGSSIWKEYEVYDFLLMFEYLKKNGKWFEFDPEVIAQAKDDGFELKEKSDGEARFINYLTDNPEITLYFYKKFEQIVDAS